MGWPVLMRRRRVLAPTALGWVLVAAFVATSFLWVRFGAYGFLALDRPCGARILIVEGWIEREGLDQALAALRNGGYERAVTSGGPIASWADRLGFQTYAELAADYFVRQGVPADCVTAAPAPASAQERTFLSAVEVRERLRGMGIEIEAVDVFSWGCHARRSRLMYQLAFGSSVQVGVLAGRPSQYGEEDWWRSSQGAKAVLQEGLSWMWAQAFFWPPEAGSSRERWGASVWGG